MSFSVPDAQAGELPIIFLSLNLPKAQEPPPNQLWLPLMGELAAHSISHLASSTPLSWKGMG